MASMKNEYLNKKIHEIVDEIYSRRKEKDIPYARDNEKFKEALCRLGERYKKLKVSSTHLSKGQNKGIQKVLFAAEQLEIALKALKPSMSSNVIDDYMYEITPSDGEEEVGDYDYDGVGCYECCDSSESPEVIESEDILKVRDERKIIDTAKGIALSVFFEKNKQNNMYYDAYSDDELISPRKTDVLIQDISWLIAGAKILLNKELRGRRPDGDEFLVAKEFIICCHQHGWSPVKISNTSDVNSKEAKISDATLCFSAVLAYGQNEAFIKSKALSMLRKCRTNFIHTVIDHTDEYSEPVIYRGNLNETIDIEWEGSMKSIKMFMPSSKK